MVNNQYGHENPQITQVQHIAHVQNLQQFSPAYPVQPVYRPNVHNHGTPIYFKHNDVPTEKSAPIVAETENKITEIKTAVAKTEQPEKIEKMEQPEKMGKTEVPVKSQKIEPTKLPAPINQIFGVNATAKM